ncbi:hypothetical protein BLA29_002694, partial [Euroglyphus maynei]
MITGQTLKYDISSGVIPPPGTQEEWTTTKRRINHKTKQVETRVQRQIIMEDGKVIADSGPQVTTKTTEDQKSDEQEDTKHRLLGDSDVPEKYRKDIGNQVVAEKTVTHNVTKDSKEENYQYHDESLRELDGPDIHRRAVENPNKLISIENEIPAIPRGKLVHFSAKGRKTNDRDEVLEVSRLGKNGLLNTETTQTQYHEEYEDDELPEQPMIESDHNTTHQRQLEYKQGHHHDDDHRSIRTNSSLSMSKDRKSTSKKGDDDIIETSEVYRLSDKMRSLKSSKKGRPHYTTTITTRKDDASTQASLSDCDCDANAIDNVNDNDRTTLRSSFDMHDNECFVGNKPKYYYSGDQGDVDDKGFIQARVKTSKFAMQNDRVLEDKTFEEDFERSFRNDSEKFDVKRDFDRFREKTAEHTKSIRDRAVSPMLPPSGLSSTEFLHRPILETSASQPTVGRSRSFYNHQIEQLDKSHSHRTYDHQPFSSSDRYSSLPKDSYGNTYRVSTPI